LGKWILWPVYLGVGVVLGDEVSGTPYGHFFHQVQQVSILHSLNEVPPEVRYTGLGEVPLVAAGEERNLVVKIEDAVV
jgi:hypothetical protein